MNRLNSKVRLKALLSLHPHQGILLIYFLRIHVEKLLLKDLPSCITSHYQDKTMIYLLQAYNNDTMTHTMHKISDSILINEHNIGFNTIFWRKKHISVTISTKEFPEHVLSCNVCLANFRHSHYGCVNLRK